MMQPRLFKAARAAFAIAAVLGGCAAAVGKTLNVGPGQTYALPSEAIAAAADGDTVQIEPGRYIDCAVVKASRLTIVGSAANVNEPTVLADKTCAGKGVLVIQGAEVVVRQLVLSGARSADRNGAGIRAEGAGLLVDAVTFIDNENGILANSVPTGVIVVQRSRFMRNGSCEGSGGCAHGIYVNKLASLRVVDSIFRETRSGHHIKSRAARTEITGTTIEDGAQGNSSYLVELPNGGSLLMVDNVLNKGAKADNRSAAIVIGAEGVTQPTPALEIRRTRFSSGLSEPTIFVRNLSRTPAELIDTQVSGKVKLLEGTGYAR